MTRQFILPIIALSTLTVLATSTAGASNLTYNCEFYGLGGKISESFSIDSLLTLPSFSVSLG